MFNYKLPIESDGPVAREGRAAAPASINISLKQNMYQLGDAIVRARVAQACDFDLRALPVHRTLRWSVRRKLVDFFDDLALDSAFVSMRVQEGWVLLTAPGAMLYATGYSKFDYTSCWFSIWVESRARAEEVIARLEFIAADARMLEQSFTLDWRFTDSNGGLRSSEFQELADPQLLEEAYASLGVPVSEFIARYLGAPECVLILLGPPGTGKTRLVRAILAEISRRKGVNAEVMYTADKRALMGDEIFVDFITGSHDAFVIEDSDHLLQARTSGNQEMHRFLAIADGVARSQGRKIIFTTNLPNVHDIDEALTRPGRCFAVKNLRNLSMEEALRLAARICRGETARLERATATLAALQAKWISVAQVYRACG